MTACEWVGCQNDATHVFDRGLYGTMPLCAEHTELARGFHFGKLTPAQPSEATGPLRIVLYVHASKEQAYAAGQRAGLTGFALDNFKYAGTEFALTFEVNPVNGDATLIAVDERSLMDKPG